MHGSYRAIRATDGTRIYGPGAEVEALIASFPALSFVDPNPRTPMQKLASASLATTASLVLCTLGGSVENNRQSVQAYAVPTESSVQKDRVSPEKQRAAVPYASMVNRPSAADARAEMPAVSPDAAVAAEPTSALDEVGELSSPPSMVEVVEAEGAVEVSEAVKLQSASDRNIEPKVGPLPEIAEPLLAAPTASSPNEGGITHLFVREAGLIVGQFEFCDDGRKIRVKLESVLAVFADRFEPAEYERLANSPAAQDFVDIERLSNAGLGMRYDPVYDEIVMEKVIDAQARGAGIQSQEPSEYS